MKNKHAGFTLIELLIVISIVAILAVNAIPAYSQYLQKARRADAHTALLSLQLAQEKFRVNCPNYASNIGNTTECDTTTPTYTLTAPSVSPEGHYDLTIVSAGGTTYALKATPATGSPQTNDTNCSTINGMTIDQDSTKNPADCW